MTGSKVCWSATNGVYVTREPIRMTGPSTNIELNGTLNLVGDRIDAKLLVTFAGGHKLADCGVDRWRSGGRRRAVPDRQTDG